MIIQKSEINQFYKLNYMNNFIHHIFQYNNHLPYQDRVDYHFQ